MQPRHSLTAGLARRLTSRARAASLAIVLIACSSAVSQAQEPAARMLALGGDVAEILARLGLADRLIARDDTVTYPPELAELPSVGYLRRLSGESVLGLAPDWVIASDAAGPREVLAQIAASGVTLVEVQTPPRLEAINDKVRLIARAVGRDAAGEALATEIDDRLARLDRLAPLTGLKVMFMLHHGGMTPMIGGRATIAQQLIDALGADNAFAEMQGYKPVSAEGLVPAAPEVVIVPEDGLAALGGEPGLWRLPGLAQTPAAETRWVVPVDSVALMNLGPRTPQALIDLHRRLAAGPAQAAAP
ncbi:heme/hemin ABC transporter substrate-binding protein [Halomonas sp. V046]|uniref:heme/hemin ABC transporter substrate-binding protein n=1 Tax=Halomonas sp. V046 TaxID=3459611 RepID=UPI0040449822